ncbi:[NiFe]-hydrogenase, small subunit [Syntrophomonas zehnderi OL-4]|uniref:[NiFe]-hydrogenase, small subunit n=1 Tax=Syntrophomonas zehnderi OL-4 TaxID=690567 RepID=A0A0E4C864_9FIRM|nr:hydrogenase small subunit [Syntrophomonas zehnderi]CFX27958.1 [NiFe]-hydrogenase, small subunit [Syntrophomonas zehnderi OL-4]
MPTKLSRRDFVKLCAGSAAAISMSGLLAPYLAQAVEAGAPPVIWIQGASCTGCSISLLNTVHPDIKEVLLNTISVRYHPNLSAASGDLAVNEGIFKTARDNPKKYFLVVEGAVPTGADGMYCMVGERNGQHITFLDMVKELGSQAAAILNFGTCSAYGGLPATPPNPTGCKAVGDVVKNVPIVNVPGCPPHPDWMVGTIAHVLLYKDIPELDSFGRPKMFFSHIIHDNCERRQYFDNAIFAKNFGEPGCLLELGCKGPMAFCDSSTRPWNGGVNWCIRAGAPCLACTEPQFPGWPIYERMPEMPIGPAMTATVDQIGGVLGAAAVLGIGGHLAGNVMTGRIGGKNNEKEGDN